MGRLLTLLRKKGPDFSPADLAGLALWLDASDLSTITHSGGAVSQWDDKSGNARHVTQGTASAQPTTGAATQNGKNVLSFDGNDTLSRTGMSVALSNTYTKILVASPSSGTDDYLWQLAESTATNQDSFITKYASKAYEQYVNGISTVRYTVGAPGSTGANLVLTVRNGSAFSSRFNGAASGSQTGSATVLNWASTYIGGSNAGNTMTGTFSEVLLYARVLSADEIASVESYLASKWGVTLA